MEQWTATEIEARAGPVASGSEESVTVRSGEFLEKNGAKLNLATSFPYLPTPTPIFYNKNDIDDL